MVLLGVLLLLEPLHDVSRRVTGCRFLVGLLSILLVRLLHIVIFFISYPEGSVGTDLVGKPLALAMLILQVVCFGKPVTEVTVIVPLFTGYLVINVLGNFLSRVKI